MAESEALEDSTSKVPQDIIHHILSFLRFLPKQAARTSILSKTWLSAWRTRPDLCFYYFPSDTDNQEIEIRRRSNFINSINTTLLRCHENQHGIINLDLRLPFVSTEHVNRWLQIAIKNSVKSLKIGFSGYPSILPQTTFEAKSLVKLVLSNLQLKPQVIRTIRCHNLRILELYVVDLDEVMFQRITSSCPLINELIVYGCVGIVNIKVTKLEKLKIVRIKLKESGCVEIQAPSLECFCYRRTTLPSTHAQLQMLPCQNLKRLDLDDIGITDEFFLDIAEKFPCLEDLKIKECQDLQRIKISSRSIKRINLEWNWNLEEAHIDVPNMDWFRFKQSAIPLLSFTAPSGPWISEIELYCWIWEILWFSDLKNLLTKLSQSEISLKIDFGATVPGWIAYELMRNSARLPPPQVENLLICFDAVLKLDDVDVTLDAIFWTCRPKTIAQEWSTSLPSKDIRVAKLIFEMLIRNQKHTILKKTNSWKSYLKDAEVVIFEDDEKVQLPPPLDWDSFLHIVSTNDFWECFYYELEWETSDMPWEQMVSQKNEGY